MSMFLAAAIQMTSSDAITENIAQAEPLMREAAARGARLISLPENTFYMRREGTAFGDITPVKEHEGVRFAQTFAAQHKCAIIIGSVRAPSPESAKFFNRCIVINAAGDIAAQYDKIHLFDVTLPSGQVFTESSQCVAGDKAVTVALDGCGLQGLSICYDVRFAQLYRTLAQRGAEVLHVPSAFTVPTGHAHWHVLLRARAIECGAYVIAPAQCGTHPGGRSTYGHSMIVSPWGDILAEAADIPCVITAEIDLKQVAKLRAQLPSLQHGRDFL